MRKSIKFLILVLLISSQQVRPCTPVKAIAGTALVGTISAVNVYRVYNNNQPVQSHDFFRDRLIDEMYEKVYVNEEDAAWAVGLGLVATVAAGCALHSVTPMARLAKAKKMLSIVQANPLLQYHGLIKTPDFVPAIQRHHGLIKTPDFVPAIQRQYASTALPYYKAFKDLKISRKQSGDAIDLINRARRTEKNSTFGEDAYWLAIKQNVMLEDLMLNVNALPGFQSQYKAAKKIEADDDILIALGSLLQLK